jgi:hypothetical protein
MSQKIKVLSFAGSLRKGSYNKALIHTAVELAPQNVSIEIFDLEGIPPFNQEFETNPPPRVKEFKDKIRDSDALFNCNTRIQLLNSRSSQKRYRLRFKTQNRHPSGRQTRRHYECIHRKVRRCPCAISFAANFRFSRHASS